MSKRTLLGLVALMFSFSCMITMGFSPRVAADNQGRKILPEATPTVNSTPTPPLNYTPAPTPNQTPTPDPFPVPAPTNPSDPTPKPTPQPTPSPAS